MVVFVWLAAIKKMIQYESMQEYQESLAYEYDMQSNNKDQRTMIGQDTKIWKE